MDSCLSQLTTTRHNRPQLATSHHIPPQKFFWPSCGHHNSPQPTEPIITPVAPATTRHNLPQPTYLAFAPAITCQNSPQPTTTHHNLSLQTRTTTHHNLPVATTSLHNSWRSRLSIKNERFVLNHILLWPNGLRRSAPDQVVSRSNPVLTFLHLFAPSCLISSWFQFLSLQRPSSVATSKEPCVP